jgi:hypothetical protein
MARQIELLKPLLRDNDLLPEDACADKRAAHVTEQVVVPAAAGQPEMRYTSAAAWTDREPTSSFRRRLGLT